VVNRPSLASQRTNSIMGSLTIYGSYEIVAIHNIEMIIFFLTIIFYPYILKW
jgi:hypothetical protein